MGTPLTAYRRAACPTDPTVRGSVHAMRPAQATSTHLVDGHDLAGLVVPVRLRPQDLHLGAALGADLLLGGGGSGLLGAHHDGAGAGGCAAEDRVQEAGLSLVFASTAAARAHGPGSWRTEGGPAIAQGSAPPRPEPASPRHARVPRGSVSRSAASPAMETPMLARIANAMSAAAEEDVAPTGDVTTGENQSGGVRFALLRVFWSASGKGSHLPVCLLPLFQPASSPGAV